MNDNILKFPLLPQLFGWVVVPAHIFTALPHYGREVHPPRGANTVADESVMTTSISFAGNLHLYF